MKSAFQKKISDYYSNKINTHGKTSKGVDWNDKSSHFLRFEQLDIFFKNKKSFSILDYGCGYGSLIEYLESNKYNFEYIGYDISYEMIRQAKLGFPNYKFTNKIEKRTFDFVVANGIFNVKLDFESEKWEQYIFSTINQLNKLSEKGFSFNVLSSYSDKHMMSKDLFYANPLDFFDYCKRNFSKNVSLIHDYGLYEFTILVKK
jgi:SAM-dependent methyltransferase